MVTALATAALNACVMLLYLCLLVNFDLTTPLLPFQRLISRSFFIFSRALKLLLINTNMNFVRLDKIFLIGKFVDLFWSANPLFLKVSVILPLLQSSLWESCSTSLMDWFAICCKTTDSKLELVDGTTPDHMTSKGSGFSSGFSCSIFLVLHKVFLLCFYYFCFITFWLRY